MYCILSILKINSPMITRYPANFKSIFDYLRKQQITNATKKWQGLVVVTGASISKTERIFFSKNITKQLLKKEVKNLSIKKWIAIKRKFHTE